ncbi:UDP-N-acetylmuramyl pentapeptide phosphotransferase/UDP-N-acetylglucosamine-1-phosphate transferase [Silvimonas terrae]|uniref:UDP-N-acetylmuramyl pentapeptide phosphotransferase/UDP-N-acetylglucosamine-1-phosphate transferase n=1 Tax=Silvimonas terrae TaxID=300266 RepID=A0A840RH97_9NEIS|nr:glycosyltransferase [Silvimonas terrae]MBB5192447.1 UDP-N-acetylmuramyl pentapeptide phosphotransferase/UDP-N-acetylglucosamine-1-phosphate transferase [Silvimonas terrae]
MSLLYLFIALLVSFIVCMLLVHYAHAHAHVTGDHDTTGVQKFHDSPVPRVGGLALFAGMLSTLPAMFVLENGYDAHGALCFMLTAAAPLAGGVAEDVLKRGFIKLRLAAMIAGTLLMIALLGWRVVRLDISSVDHWLTLMPLLSVCLTVFAVTGVTNAINIIDGYNGLASAVSMIILTSIVYIALKVGDRQIAILAISLLGACAGFIFWNWPRGLIFLGDGGAYILGFVASSLAVALVMRNPAVSAWYALVLMLYPIVETVFTINRRVFRKDNPGFPDAAHLHQLIYKRMMRWAVGSCDVADRKMRNSMTSPYLWLFSSLSVIPASIFWQHGHLLQLFTLAFVLAYLWLYRRLARFRTPKWLIFRKPTKP